VSIALVLSGGNPDSTPTPHRAGRIPRHRSSSGYCPRSSLRESAALAAGCFETHVSVYAIRHLYTAVPNIVVSLKVPKGLGPQIGHLASEEKYSILDVNFGEFTFHAPR
jgi:hypothetical protein